jgi:hypothetical protein
MPLDKTLKRRLEATINKVRADAEPGSDFVPSAVARAVLNLLSPGDCEVIALEFISDIAKKMEQQAVAAAASQTGWLDLPEYQHIRAAVRGETLEQYRERMNALEKRIESYAYARRAEEKLQEDEQELREMRRLEPRITPYFAGDPAMTVERAVELLKQTLQTAATDQRRKAVKSATKARWGRMKNQ